MYAHILLRTRTRTSLDGNSNLDHALRRNLLAPPRPHRLTTDVEPERREIALERCSGREDEASETDGRSRLGLRSGVAEEGRSLRRGPHGRDETRNATAGSATSIAPSSARHTAKETRELCNH